MLVTLGGCDNNCDEIKTVECTNPATNHCRSLACSPQGMRRGFSAVVLDEDIFVTGEILMDSCIVPCKVCSFIPIELMYAGFDWMIDWKFFRFGNFNVSVGMKIGQISRQVAESK